jgi:hypothetical protein
MKKLCISVLIALMFGAGVVYGTVITVRADMSRSLREQRKEFEAAVWEIVSRKGSGQAGVFRTK